ncbi:MAG: hypothetical protein J6O55_07275 [Lachnospiraceae bacterium]|nr:hypothetical protein [Lachnospiraceae bacterium]
MGEIGKRLMVLLKNIYDNHDFVCGAMSNCAVKGGWEKMYNIITLAKKQGDIITADGILALSLKIGGAEEYGIALESNAELAKSIDSHFLAIPR